MGTTNTKEEVIVPQNAAGGNNSADIRQLAVHASSTNIILLVLLLMISLAFLYGIFTLYRRCHRQWMADEIRRDRLRFSLWRRRADRERDLRDQPEDAIQSAIDEDVTTDASASNEILTLNYRGRSFQNRPQRGGRFSFAGRGRGRVGYQPAPRYGDQPQVWRGPQASGRGATGTFHGNREADHFKIGHSVEAASRLREEDAGESAINRLPGTVISLRYGEDHRRAGAGLLGHSTETEVGPIFIHQGTSVRIIRKYIL
uniref:Uncharacterized protein n=1 Tax=Heliothis virescens TaxID=7102 RepID=A0A2A4IZH6_HELVI